MTDIRGHVAPASRPCATHSKATSTSTVTWERVPPLTGGASFGHAGAGGSLGLADPDRRVGFAYVMNRMSANLSDDPRTAGLIAALKESLD